MRSTEVGRVWQVVLSELKLRRPKESDTPLAVLGGNWLNCWGLRELRGEPQRPNQATKGWRSGLCGSSGKIESSKSFTPCRLLFQKECFGEFAFAANLE